MAGASEGVEHRVVAVPGASLHVALAGPPSGTPVVLLHGFPETWWSWRHQIAPLAAAGCRVIAPDLRGYGASSRGGPFDLDTLAGDVVALLAALGVGPAVVVGHDWGGGTAWHLAAHHPDVVRRLIVVNCPLPHVLEAQLARAARWSQVKRSWYIYFFQLPFIAEWLIGRHAAGNVLAAIRNAAVVTDRLGDAELAPIREAARPLAARRAMLGPYRAAFRAAVRRGFRPTEPPVVAAETLLVWGLEDPALGYDDLVPGTERWAPRLRTVTLPGIGHFPQAEAPEVVTELVRAFALG